MIHRKSLLPLTVGAALIAGLLSTAVAQAEVACKFCDKEIVLDAALAQCFLERYPELADSAGTPVFVDLSDCPGDRGIVDALVVPDAATLTPNEQFRVTKLQLGCLKKQLDNRAVSLEPPATLKLDSCG